MNVTPFPTPQIPFLTIYQLNWSATAEPLVLGSGLEWRAYVQHGALTFREPVALIQSSSGVAGMMGGTQVHELPPANYLLVERFINPLSTSRYEASVWNAEIVTTLELCSPLIVGKRMYEGPVQTDKAFALLPEGPMTLWGRPGEAPADLVSHFQEGRVAVDQLLPAVHDRYLLASRWYARGHDALNPIDRLLFFYICLEIFPATGTSDVPKAVCELVRSRLAPDLSLAEVKERLKIGRIAGLRAEVVHNGLAFVDVTRDRLFADLLRRLEAIVTVCMRTLADVPLGSELDAYLRPAAAAPNSAGPA